MPMDRMKMVSLEPGWNRSTVQNWTADNFRDHETSPSHHQRGTKARWLNPALAAETVGRSVEPSSRRDGFGCDGETSERVAADTTILWNLKYFSLSKLPLYRINKGGYQIKLRLPPLPSLVSTPLENLKCASRCRIYIPCPGQVWCAFPPPLLAAHARFSIYRK